MIYENTDTKKLIFNDGFGNEYELPKDFEKICKQNAAMRIALEYYADEKNWVKDWRESANDDGERARAVLAEIKGEGEK